jgi:hypothetical protein
VELKKIEAETDALLERLVSTASAAEVQDICTRLEGLSSAARVKATVASRTSHNAAVQEHEDRAPCGFRWSWPDADVNHFEICSLPAKHVGDHRNNTTGVTHALTKPIADQLHEATSRWRSHADSFEKVAADGSEETGLVTAFRSCARELEALLLEGGI